MDGVSALFPFPKALRCKPGQDAERQPAEHVNHKHVHVKVAAISKPAFFIKLQRKPGPANVVRAAGHVEEGRQAAVGLYMRGQQVGDQEEQQGQQEAGQEGAKGEGHGVLLCCRIELKIIRVILTSLATIHYLIIIG